MDENDALLKKRFTELAQRSFDQGIYTYTDFLDMHQCALLTSLLRAIPAECTLFGGTEGCERQMAMFGSVASCGYEGTLPIKCVFAAPAGARFADELSHRDFLGALMNLGIKREKLGDIVLRDNCAYIFCDEGIAPYIADNLTQVKHTSVRCKAVDSIPESAAPKFIRIRIQAASERADAVIAKVYSLSREDAQTLFRQQKVFLNGAELSSPGKTLALGDIVSVRGFGRFSFSGVAGETRKGKLSIDIDKFGG